MICASEHGSCWIKSAALLQGLAASCCLFQPTAFSSDFLVHFDQDRYDITAGELFAPRILIDPAPESGLYSFGVKLALSSSNASVTSASAIGIPGGLNFDGVAGNGAVRVVGTGFAAAKGTVNF